jgi:hypothetical protein
MFRPATPNRSRGSTSAFQEAEQVGLGPPVHRPLFTAFDARPPAFGGAGSAAAAGIDPFDHLQEGNRADACDDGLPGELPASPEIPPRCSAALSHAQPSRCAHRACITPVG